MENIKGNELNKEISMDTENQIEGTNEFIEIIEEKENSIDMTIEKKKKKIGFVKRTIKLIKIAVISIMALSTLILIMLFASI